MGPCRILPANNFPQSILPMKYLVALLAICLLPSALVPGAEPATVVVGLHSGQPTLLINGRPDPLPSYSLPAHFWDTRLPQRTTPRFAQHQMGAYFLCLPRVKDSSDFFATPFWDGDRISSTALQPSLFSLEQQVDLVSAGDKQAWLIVRLGLYEPATWRKLHPDQLVVNDQGEVLQTPSLASDLYWDAAARYCQAVIEHCENQPWASRLIGYANFLRVEGSHEPLIFNWMFDHGPVMTARWRKFLQEKYRTVDALRAAHNDPKLTFDNAVVPGDRLRGTVPQVSAILYWQNASENQPLRDYLLLMRDLFHAGFRKVAAATQQACDRLQRKRLLVYDGLKQTMLGWDNIGYFDLKSPWPLVYPDLMAGSGHMQVPSLMEVPGMGGLITPHDYQARGVGGVYEPEGIVDSLVLRGKYFFSEMDTRTYGGKDHHGRSDNDQQFDAVTWRNLATALTRGFNSYWMDLHEDWFFNDRLHRTIGRQVEVVRQSVDFSHETMPGIAMLLDDQAVLETNGSGNFHNEAVMTEWKTGMARCGVPARIYLLEDLRLPNFPKHRVYYFPNLFRVDAERLALLKEKVFRDGNVVLWGPGSGISDGKKLGPESAALLTGFQFEYMPTSYMHRVQLQEFSHPITAGLKADAMLGGPLAYGPLLFPKDGRSLGMAWTKQGRNYCGLAVKTFGKGARGENSGNAAVFGPGDWASVFTTAVPIPADMWRGLARLAGAHVYCETNDVLMADSSVVGLHSIQSGRKQVRLPRQCKVTDLISGKLWSERSDRIEFDLTAPETRVFLVQ